MEYGEERECGATEGWIGDQATKLAHRVGIAVNPFRLELEWVAFNQMVARGETIKQEDYSTVYDMFIKSELGKDLRENGPVRVASVKFTCKSKKPDAAYVVNKTFVSTMPKIHDAMEDKSRSLVEKLDIDVHFDTDEKQAAFQEAIEGALNAFNLVLATPALMRGKTMPLRIPIVVYDGVAKELVETVGDLTVAFDQLFSPTAKHVRIGTNRSFMIMERDNLMSGAIWYNPRSHRFDSIASESMRLEDSTWVFGIPDGANQMMSMHDVHACDGRSFEVLRRVFTTKEPSIRKTPASGGAAHDGEDEDEDDVNVVGNGSLDPIRPYVVAPADPVYDQAAGAKASDDSAGQFCVLI